MSISFSTTYAEHIAQKSIKENWIVQLYYGDESNFTGVSFRDTTVGSVQYLGAISNSPSVRSSINLKDSTSQTSNISIELANFNFNGADFSTELVFGTNNYINRTVKIYSQLANDATLSNCNQIYQGRLVSVNHTHATITLEIEEKRPWDYITFPQDKAAQKNIYIPVVYGDFSGNTVGDEVRSMNKDLFPAPVLRLGDSDILALMPDSSSSILPHYYETSLDAFIPLETSEYTSATQSNAKYDSSANVGLIKKTLERSFKTDPVSVGGTDEADSGTSDNILLYSHSGFATLTNAITTSDAAGTAKSRQIEYNFPSITGKFTALKAICDADISIGSNGTSGNYDSKTFLVHGGTLAEFNTMTTNQSGNGTFDLSSQTLDILSVAYTSNDNQLDTPFKIQGSTDLDNGIQANITTAHQINKFQLEMKVKNNFDDPERLATEKDLEKLEYLYFGHDGRNNDFTGGSGVADTGLEIHRSLLTRFAGVDSTPTNYSSGLNIAGARVSTAWKGLLWHLEPVELKRVLEQLQYEFGFIFKFRPDGSTSYLYIKDSYSSGDVSATLNTDDINNIRVQNSPFTELQTKLQINYKKHPSRSGEYTTSQTSTDTSGSSARTKYNIGTKENISNIDLDYNVNKPGNTELSSGDPNDGFADYYFNIFGDIKKVISCDILNVQKGYVLETGDIVQFGTMPFTPFGSNWNNYYMVTSITRSPNKVSIICREVG
tara:strand:+ start:3337 stop:5493 length:2157 start_codon:yes stop_codon:yes gene_type:complete